MVSVTTYELSLNTRKRGITIWCSIFCMNNLLLKNYLKHVHHSDLFIALFDLSSLSLA